jgi:ribosomal protein L11
LDTINAPEINTIIPSEVEPNPQIDIQKLTSEEMKSKEFIEKLNEKAKEQREIRVQDSSFPWKYRTKTSSWYVDNKINDGYPILSDVNYGG